MCASLHYYTRILEFNSIKNGYKFLELIAPFGLILKINERSYYYDEFQKQEIFMVYWRNIIGIHMENEEKPKVQ